MSSGEQPFWFRMLLRKLKQKQQGLGMASEWYSLADFRKQLDAIPGQPLTRDMLKSIPGMALDADGIARQAKSDCLRIAAMIDATTPIERTVPSIIDPARRRRIARGSGTNEDDVGKLIHNFGAMRRMFRQMAAMTHPRPNDDPNDL
jgi:signal recognition particle subunit SRP54